MLYSLCRAWYILLFSVQVHFIIQVLIISVVLNITVPTHLFVMHHSGFCSAALLSFTWCNTQQICSTGHQYGFKNVDYIESTTWPSTRLYYRAFMSLYSLKTTQIASSRSVQESRQKCKDYLSLQFGPQMVLC